MKKIVFILFSILLLSSCVSKSEYEDLEYENQKLKREIAELEDRVDELEDMVDELEDRLYDAENIIDEAKRACYIWDDDTYMVLSVLNQY